MLLLYHFTLLIENYCHQYSDNYQNPFLNHGPSIFAPPKMSEYLQTTSLKSPNQTSDPDRQWRLCPLNKSLIPKSPVIMPERPVSGSPCYSQSSHHSAREKTFSRAAEETPQRRRCCVNTCLSWKHRLGDADGRGVEDGMAVVEKGLFGDDF